ncbi:MAG: ABC transporter ATP-binding protein [Candidatus Hydrogenedentota bacterium]
MARIEMKNIGHRYSADADKSGFALEALNMTWQDASANALLGPSGCGKTTLLNMISGLLRPQTGSILFDGEDITRQSPKARHIAQVFQFPVVYDSMNVEQNLGFPLKNDKMTSGEIKNRVHKIADLLELDGVLKRKPHQLTAAEKQKVSLGRGIVRTDTAAVLLDEPLTVIDPQQKWELRRKLKQVQTELKLTMIYVTHDQQEALTFADHVTIMRNGAIEQSGSPAELYDHPASPFIGFFIGSPGMNFLDIESLDGKLTWENEGISIDHQLASDLSASHAPFTLGIRPEHIIVSNEAKPGHIETDIHLLEDTGAYKILTLERGARKLKARIPDSMSVAEGDRVWVSFPPEAMRFYQEDRCIG